MVWGDGWHESVAVKDSRHGFYSYCAGCFCVPGVFGTVHNERHTIFWARTTPTHVPGPTVPTDPVILTLAAEDTAGAAGALG